MGCIAIVMLLCLCITEFYEFAWQSGSGEGRSGVSHHSVPLLVQPSSPLMRCALEQCRCEAPIGAAGANPNIARILKSQSYSRTHSKVILEKMPRVRKNILAIFYVAKSIIHDNQTARQLEDISKWLRIQIARKYVHDSGQFLLCRDLHRFSRTF